MSWTPILAQNTPILARGSAKTGGRLFVKAGERVGHPGLTCYDGLRLFEEIPMETEKKWADLTPVEKREQRYQWWLSPDVKFSSPEAGEKYRERAQRFIDAYRVEKPDRVPVSLPVGNWPAYLAGTDLHTVMYDYDKLQKAWKRFYDEFETDSAVSPGMVLPARAYDRLDYKLYSWPGHGLPKSSTGIQFVEGEYMKEEEYDLLIKDPSDFWMRFYIPRIFGAFESWKFLSPFTSIIEAPGAWFLPYTRPEMQASAQALVDVGKELAAWSQVIAEFNRWVQESGYPVPRMVFAKAPFDTIGDTLRGTKGIIRDLFRRPEKLMEAMDVVADFTIRQTVAAANATGGLIAIFPLHKGSDGFMSQKQFEKFYWPPLKKVVDALVNEGILPELFAEGSYTSRLETVNEFSKGAVSWLFDKTDMALAKKIVGKTCCISGNVPSSLMVTGGPNEVKEYCRKLIEVCAPGGGFILSGGAQVDQGNPDNLRAMMEAAKEYGR
jgi:uroporphyrinogen-III decarboxylase